MIEGTHPARGYPRVLGHEMLGTAQAGRYAGRPVVVDPLVSCGRCSACRRGHPHVCRHLKVAGVHLDGGLSEAIMADEARLHPVPDGLDLRSAALTEPLAVAVHAVRRGGDLRNETAVVVGAGPIGLLVALVARDSGAARVLFIERAERRRQFAANLGFDVLDQADPIADLASRTGGEMADVAFDAAGSRELSSRLTQLLRPRARLVLMGLYGEPPPIDCSDAVLKELQLLGSRVYEAADIDRALELLHSGCVDGGSLVSAVVSLEEVGEAFQKLVRGEMIKVLVCPSRDCHGE